MNKRHPTKVLSKLPAEVAKEVGALRYDKAIEFLDRLALDYARQAAADRARGRIKLAAKLDTLADAMVDCAYQMRAIFALCKPHLEEELNERSSYAE